MTATSKYRMLTVGSVPPRVLVVDDDDLFRSIVVQVLRYEGFEVLAASNGHQALAYLRQQPTDLLITDLRMPVLDGLGLVRACQAEAKLRRLPIIMISAELPTDLRRVASVGGQEVISKPCDLDLLLSTISRLIRSSD